MPIMRLFLALALAILLSAAFFTGCGRPPASPESSWREEVDGSLQALEAAASFRYRLSIETWIGVSGQSVYGDERGEGLFVDKDFFVQLLRTSPAGAEALAVASQEVQVYLQEDGQWRLITIDEMPTPLCNPFRFPELASGYGTISLEGEEVRDGNVCNRYLLQLNSDQARDALGPRAWSYFSQLRFELNCRLWVGDPSAPPVSIQLEVVGFDPEENLQRYRELSTMDPYDINSPDIQITAPTIPAQI
jgi:hypothetical protein